MVPNSGSRGVIAPSGQVQKSATVALAEMPLLQGELGIGAARRLVLRVRAVTADETRPHASEELTLGGNLAGKLVVEICEQAKKKTFLQAAPTTTGWNLVWSKWEQR